jgi:hypothetical protein
MPRLCLLALALVFLQPGQPLTLEIRVFRGSDDVTGQTRVTVHRAGERGQPVAHVPIGEPRSKVKVVPGIYDAQAVQLHTGIRSAADSNLPRCSLRRRLRPVPRQ